MKILLIIIVVLVAVFIVLPIVAVIMLSFTKGGREFLGQIGCDPSDDSDFINN